MSKLTGFSPKVRKVIKDRAGYDDLGGCERCGKVVEEDEIQIHHRRPRGQGGSKAPDTNLPANGFALCLPCHAWVEDKRDEALGLGFLSPQHRIPSEVPVLRRGMWVQLFNDGDYIAIPEPSGGRVA